VPQMLGQAPIGRIRRSGLRFWRNKSYCEGNRGVCPEGRPFFFEFLQVLVANHGTSAGQLTEALQFRRRQCGKQIRIFWMALKPSFFAAAYRLQRGTEILNRNRM
jgi:hypothetical protein